MKHTSHFNLYDDQSPSADDDTIVVERENPAAGESKIRRTGLGVAVAAGGNGVFATAAQGDLADTSLQPGDIGDSVQAHSDVLDATTASFLVADETKLDGIEAGADVTDAGNVDPLIAAQVGVTVQAHGANLDTLSGITPGTAGQAILADSTVADVRTYISAAPYVANLTALKALDTTKDAVAVLNTSARAGVAMAWVGSDLSSTVLPYSFTTTSADTGTDTFSLRTITTTAVNTSSDTFTANAHGGSNGDAYSLATTSGPFYSDQIQFLTNVAANTFQLRKETGGIIGISGSYSDTPVFKAVHRGRTGDAVYVSATADLSAETIYYLICPDRYTFKLATSRDNALSGTAIDLTVTTNITVRVAVDADEARFVKNALGTYDASSGAWVSENYKEGRTFHLLEFGDVAGSDDNATMRKAVAACHVYATITGAMPTLVLPAGRTVAIDNIRIGNSIRIVQDGCRVLVPFNDAGHADYPGTTERLYYCETSDTVRNIIIEGGAVYGCYDGAVALNTPRSLMNFEGAYRFTVDGVKFRECGTGSTGVAAQVYYERDHSLVRSLNCRYAEVINCDFEDNTTYEEIMIMDSNAVGSRVCRFNVSYNFFRNGILSNTPFTPILCLGGTFIGNSITNYNNSAVNILCDNVFCAGNLIDGVTGSAGFDAVEAGGYYLSANCVFIGNIIRNCATYGILAGGHGTIVSGNTITGCGSAGIQIDNRLTTQVNIEAVFGSGANFTEYPVSGIYVGQNILDDNGDYNIYVVGNSSTTQISCTLEGNRTSVGAAISLRSIRLENVSKAVVRGGELNDGDSQVVLIAGTCGTISFEDLTIRYSGSTAIGHGIHVAATSVKRLALRNVDFPDAPNTSQFDINLSAGTIGAVTMDGVTGAASLNGLTTTPIFYNGVLKGSGTLDLTSTAAATVGTAGTLTVAGARVGDVVSGVARTQSVARFDYEVTADNTVSVFPINASAGAVDPASTVFDVVVFGNLNTLIA